MDTQSSHLLMEFYNCNRAKLNHEKSIILSMEQGAVAAGATVITSHSHKFMPQGVSAFLLLKESHFSIHTWPEHKFASADFYSCGNCSAEVAANILRQFLEADSVKFDLIQRGVF